MLMEILYRNIYLFIYLFNLLFIICRIIGCSIKKIHSVNILMLLAFLIINTLFIILDFTPLIKSLVTLILIFVSAIMFINERKIIKIVFFVFFILLLLESIIIGILQIATRSDIYKKFEDYQIYLFATMLYTILIISFYMFSKKNQIMIKYILRNLAVKHYIMFIMGLLSFCLLVSYLGYISLTQYNPVTNLLIFIALCIITIAFFIIGFYMVFTIYKNEYYQDILKLSEKCLKQQEEYYKSILDKERETKKFRHDLNNHLISLKHLYNNGRYVELGEYIYCIESTVSDLDIGIHTGNDIVNAVINNIIPKDNDIEFLWKGIVPVDIKISQMDLCTIFSNIITNSVEAVLSLTDSDKKYINVKVDYISGMLKIDIKNNCNAIAMNDINLNTIKKDKLNHGFGLENVKRCIGNYGGEINYNINQNEFQLIIHLYHV